MHAARKQPARSALAFGLGAAPTAALAKAAASRSHGHQHAVSQRQVQPCAWSPGRRQSQLLLSLSMSSSGKEKKLSPWSDMIGMLSKATTILGPKRPMVTQGSVPVRVIEDSEEFYMRVRESTQKLAVVMFHAPDCKACKVVIPQLSQVAYEFESVADLFLMDISRNKSLCRELQVTALPAFKVYVMHEGKPGVLTEFVCGGARCIAQLRRKLKRFADYDAKNYEF